MMTRFIFFFLLGLGTSSPGLTTDELRCRFFGVVGGSGAVSVARGVEVAADGSVTGSDGGGIGPLFGFSTVNDDDGRDM